MAGWEHLAAMLPRSPRPALESVLGGPKARKTRWFQMDNKSAHGREREKGLSKVKERSGNVYENKGSGLHRRERSGNVIENKGSYALKAGMLLKRQVVSRW